MSCSDSDRSCLSLSSGYLEVSGIWTWSLDDSKIGSTPVNLLTLSRASSETSLITTGGYSSSSEESVWDLDKDIKMCEFTVPVKPVHFDWAILASNFLVLDEIRAFLLLAVFWVIFFLFDDDIGGTRDR